MSVESKRALELCAAADPGPWRVDHYAIVAGDEPNEVNIVERTYHPERAASEILIAEARTLLPALAEQVGQLEKERDEERMWLALVIGEPDTIPRLRRELEEARADLAALGRKCTEEIEARDRNAALCEEAQRERDQALRDLKRMADESAMALEESIRWERLAQDRADQIAQMRDDAGESCANPQG